MPTSILRPSRAAFVLSSTLLALAVATSPARATMDCEVDFSVGSSPALGAMGWSADYAATGGSFVGTWDKPACTNKVPGALAAFTDHDAQSWIQGAFVVDPVVSTPRVVATCIWRGEVTPLAGDFSVVASDASDVDAEPVIPVPPMSVTRVSCVPSGVTTTLASTTTTTTLPPPVCENWLVKFRLSSGKSVASLQFDVDYSAAEGGFDGAGSTVSCTKQVATANFAANDAEAKKLLTLGLVDLAGFSAPKDLAICNFTHLPDAPLVPEDFELAIIASDDPDSEPLTVNVQVLVEPVGECTPACGDGVRQGDEECDDGNLSNTDGCLAGCVAATCGDGYVRTGVEQCDDENASNADACTNSCLAAKCGDGHVRTGLEQCDDGNLSNADACTNSCVPARCGDGFVRSGVEPCDDANTSNTDSCLNGCVLPTCGDGYVRTGVEGCDDGNQVATDACPTTCQPARCGDGFVRTGTEQCDDGNLSNADACVGTCVAAKCGDGFVRTGVEQCDDGNAVDQDGCSPACAPTLMCGDATGDHKVVAGDALRTLQRAVSLDVYCPDWVCDGNGDGRVSASDALVTLTASVGLPVTWKCPPPRAVVLRLASASTLGSLQLDLDYDGVAADLDGDAGQVQCTGNVTGALYVFNDKPQRLLTMSMIQVEGFSGPRDLARCSLTPTGLVDASAFAVSIVDALTPAGTAAGGVQVKALLY